MVTYKSIAERANVSVSTVSRVLSNKGKISEGTKEAVIKAAQDLDYFSKIIRDKPKDAKQFSLVGFIIADSKNYFFQQFASQLERFLQEKNCSLLVSYYEQDQNAERKCLENMLRIQPSVLLYIPSSNQNANILAKLSRMGIPILQLFANFYREYAAYIIDDYHSMLSAVDLLIQNGHRKIAFIENELPYISQKHKGYQDALEVHGLECSQNNLFTLPVRMDRGRILKKLIEKHTPTALIVSDSVKTLLALRVCNDLHLSIPEDISVISIDDSEWQELLSITSAHISYEEVAYDVSTLIIKLMVAPTEMEHFYHKRPSQLVARGSVQNLLNQDTTLIN